ncbi:MAG: hypothetical protein M3404_02555 [Actinomycetota bacterium]|nr:hypothetical protein [Actinomycetota bacterium]
MGFLDDGTLVVVTDAAALVGQEVDVSISSAVQTSRGRMLFASLWSSEPTFSGQLAASPSQAELARRA